MIDGNFVLRLKSMKEVRTFLGVMEKSYKAAWRSGKKPTNHKYEEYFNDEEVDEFCIGATEERGGYVLWYEDFNQVKRDGLNNYEMIESFETPVYRF